MRKTFINGNKKQFLSFLRKKLDDKNALHYALKNGFSIEKLAKERGLNLVHPI